MARNQFVLAAIMLLAMAVADVLAASAGCGKSPTLTSGTKSITVNGRTRQYIIRVPDNYDRNRQYRLIFGFHWFGGTMTDVATGQTVQRDVWSYYGLQRLASNSAIFVAPQGNNNGWANSGGEDVAFVDQMIRTIEADLCVNERLRFATGFSYGGSMSQILACQRSTVFRAVAVLSVSGPVAEPCGTSPIAYLGIHGIGDDINRGRRVRDYFVRNNGCTANNRADPASGSRTHVKTVYSGCRPEYPVWWITFDGGHIAAPYDGGSGDNGSRAFSPPETWSFFSQFT